MKKKSTILIIGLILFLILVHFLNSSATGDTDLHEKNKNDKKNTKINDDVELTEYLNLEAENKKLFEKIDLLEYELFEYKKALIDPESNDIMFENKTLDTLSLYQEVTDNKIIILANNQSNGGYRLTIATKDKEQFNDIVELTNEEFINYSGSNGFYSGLIKGNDIISVTVFENEKAYESEIVKITENLNLWYTTYDHERKNTQDNPNKIKIEAYDKKGNVIWKKFVD